MKLSLGHALLASFLFAVEPQSATATEPTASTNPASQDQTPTPPSTSVPTPTEAPPASSSPETPAPLPAVPPVADVPLQDKPTETTQSPAIPIARKGFPRLHIQADRPGVRLMQIDRAMSDEMGEGILVRTICTAPCDQVISAQKRQTFFFGADGMVPSRGFKLSKLQGNITARVQGGSLAARQIGFLLGGFGGTAVLGGLTMLGVGYTNSGSHLSSEGKVVEGSNTTLTTGGFIVLGVGAAMVTTAIVLVATAKTRITLVQDDDKSARLTWEAGVLRF